uniref:Uncharacterized protein n=1 Tax=Arundo donax TaxID=35708 RepID=A0A0A9BG56_ARUDO
MTVHTNWVQKELPQISRTLEPGTSWLSLAAFLLHYYIFAHFSFKRSAIFV